MVCSQSRAPQGPLQATAGHSLTPAPHCWGTARRGPLGAGLSGSQSSRLRSAVGSVGSREATSDCVPPLSPWRRSSCTSSRGGSPGSACAEWGTSSTGSAGSRLTRTRELRLHPLATGLRPHKAQPPTPPRGPPGVVLAAVAAPRFSGRGRPSLPPRKSCRLGGSGPCITAPGSRALSILGLPCLSSGLPARLSVAPPPGGKRRGSP